uniref:SH3 domain-containing protein n=1 Tax=Denticeps clupeoides TaxID=299321 RepID=A0AAY4B1K4_9TELE
MSFLNTLRQWDKAVGCAEQKNTETALEVFLDIEDKNSKISYNIGCLHLANGDFDAAEKAFDFSIGKDGHLAVAFAQRGITFYKKEKYEEALADFKLALKELRDNNLIDYSPLGLRYKLHACEVLHNMGLVHAQLGDWEKAQENLFSALARKAEAKFKHIDLALEAILKHKLFELAEIRPGLLFKPNQKYVSELEKKDYLGKAKVVASVVHQDEFSGFAPLQPQVEDVPSTPIRSHSLRALKGEPHTVLYEFYPETVEELAVLPGNVVFVLEKGTDHWASVIFNERVSVPKNRFTVTLSLNDDAIPGPPVRNPPARPKRRTPSKKMPSLSERTEDPGESAGCLMKVHFLYTVVITVLPGIPYRTLLHKISTKLNLPASAITLSYVKSGKKVTIDESEMTSVWKGVVDGRLTLWCALSQTTPAITQVVALHSYESTNPEDLQFRQGDVITVLSKVNADWLEGRCNGKTGIFPASFVQHLKKDH